MKKKKTSIWEKKLPVNDIGFGLYCTWIFFNDGPMTPTFLMMKFIILEEYDLLLFAVFGFVIEAYAIMKNPD